MYRLKFTIDYKGTAYAGWQIQPDDVTVQGTIEQALDKLLGLQDALVGCGRTDSGVHGRDYVFHANVNRIHPKALYKLNRMLPDDIVVTNVEEVTEDFHARFKAKSRAYEYVITLKKEAFGSEAFYYQYEKDVDIVKLNDLQALFMNCSDFRYFKKEHGSSKTDVCRLEQFEWVKEPSGRVIFRIKGDRFLRGMVRLIVGAQLNYHRGSLSLSDLKAALDTQQPIQQPWSVPAKGLYFVGAEY